MDENRYYADGATVPAPVTPLAPAATPPPAAALAVAPASPPAGGIDVAALAAAIVSGVSGAFAPVLAQLSALQPQAPAATPPPGGAITGVVQNAVATGQQPAQPAPSIRLDERLADFTKLAGAVFGMALQQEARSLYVLNNLKRFEPPVERSKAMFGEAHPVTLALSQQYQGVESQNAFQNYNLTGQNSRDAAVGGVLVRSLMGDFIAALTERAVVRSSGARTVSSPSGVMELPGADGNTSAAYIGEGEPINFSQMTYKKTLLVSKKLAGQINWTWEALNRPVYDLFTIVLNNLLNEMALKEDLAFLRSDGTGGEPKGLITQVATANRIVAQTGWAAAAANAQIAKAEIDRSAMEGKLRDNFLYDDGSSVWFMPPIVWRWLDRARTEQSVKAFAETGQGKWGKYPVKDTTLLRSNLGGSGILAEVLLCQMSEVLIADESTLRTKTSDALTIPYAGTVKSLADLDMIGTQVIAMHDIGLMRSIAASLMPDCPYR